MTHLRKSIALLNPQRIKLIPNILLSIYFFFVVLVVWAEGFKVEEILLTICIGEKVDFRTLYLNVPLQHFKAAIFRSMATSTKKTTNFPYSVHKQDSW